MKIRIYPDPVLRIVSHKADAKDKDVKGIIKKMKVVIKKEKGVGLAANQVGVTKRIILIDDFTEVIPMLNPEIIYLSSEKEVDHEGCLSFPEISVAISRHLSLKVKYEDEKGNEWVLELEGLFARAVQHEIDHLNGILLIDYMTPEEKLEYNMRIAKEEAKL